MLERGNDTASRTWDAVCRWNSAVDSTIDCDLRARPPTRDLRQAVTIQPLGGLGGGQSRVVRIATVLRGDVPFCLGGRDPGLDCRVPKVVMAKGVVRLDVDGDQRGPNVFWVVFGGLLCRAIYQRGVGGDPVCFIPFLCRRGSASLSVARTADSAKDCWF